MIHRCALRRQLVGWRQPAPVSLLGLDSRLLQLLAFCLLASAPAQPQGLDGLLGAMGEGGPGGNPLEGLLGALGGMQDGHGGGSPKKKLCEAGSKPVPKLRVHNEYVANGCGPQGMQIKEPFGLYKCCNGHDICFSVCGTTHSWCEKEFNKCMKDVCKDPANGDVSGCQQQAETFGGLTKVLGKGFHESSQKQYCDCIPEKEVNSKHTEYLKGFFMDVDDSKAIDEDVRRLLAEWKGKEAKLYMALAKKYGPKFVSFSDIDPEFWVPEAERKKMEL